MTVPPFANPESAEARMLRALVLNIQKVKQANGYRCDIGDVKTELCEPDTLQKPAVVLVRGQSIVENEDQADQEWHKRIQYTAMVYLRSEDPTWDRLAVLADLEAMLGNNNMLPDEAGVETAREVTLDGDRPFGMVNNKPQVGLAMLFSVRIAQSIQDPTVSS